MLLFSCLVFLGWSLLIDLREHVLHVAFRYRAQAFPGHLDAMMEGMESRKETVGWANRVQRRIAEGKLLYKCIIH
jgi:hypothetical protein